MSETENPTREEQYEQIMKRRLKTVRVVMLLTFAGMGIIFAVLGIVLLLAVPNDPDAQIVGYIFTPMGLLFCLLGALLYALLPQNASYAKMQARVQKWGYTSTGDISMALDIVQTRLTDAENQIDQMQQTISAQQKQLDELNDRTRNRSFY